MIGGVSDASAQNFRSYIDILPIAAPSDAGSKFKDTTYTAFTPYVTNLIQLAQKNPTPSGLPKPMVVFGSPVRDWIKRNFGITATINEVTFISELNNTPLIGANHPSYIFHTCPCETPEWTSSLFLQGMNIMEADLISSCW